jgi:hypothetical protein
MPNRTIGRRAASHIVHHINDDRATMHSSTEVLRVH